LDNTPEDLKYVPQNMVAIKVDKRGVKKLMTDPMFMKGENYKTFFTNHNIEPKWLSVA
jgi:hypothetical protein